MKKTRVWPALLAALVILAGCAAAPPEESDPPTEEFVFTRENMPRLNGSTSAVPLAEAVCSVLLGESREEVADLVQFSRTTASYEALMAGEADLLLAGEPEQAVMERLEAGDRWLLTPFATDALVFVVNADNPVDGLTTEQLQKIYTGEITNWSQVGARTGTSSPFQRNPEAGPGPDEEAGDGRPGDDGASGGLHSGLHVLSAGGGCGSMTTAPPPSATPSTTMPTIWRWPRD